MPPSRVSPSRGSVIVVDHNPASAQATATCLQRVGYRVGIAIDGHEALLMIDATDPDVLLIDVMLPDIDGLRLLRKVRERRQTPVVLVTEHAKDTHRVIGLRLGAEDCLVKPFSSAELVARIDAVRNRTSGRRELNEPVRFDGIELDPRSRRLRVRGRDVRLTLREYELLLVLLRSPGRVFTRHELMSRVWGHTFHSDTATLSMHISRLRSKIEEVPAQPRRLQTVWGVGYRFEP